MYARATTGMFAGGSFAYESFWNPGMRRHEPFNALSMASNMSHEQRHSEVDVPTRKVDLIENIAPVPAIATTMRSDADIFLLIIATIVIEIDMITACHLTPPMGHYSMC